MALVLSLSLAAPVTAGQLEDAMASLNHGDYATALKLLRPLAQQGDVVAQGSLGYMYENGQGVLQDYAVAVKWYRKAAEQDFAPVEFNLGLMYFDGRGVQQDYAVAVKWYRKAASQGYDKAQFNLGLMYVNGQGVPQDYVRAQMWLNLAAATFPASDAANRDKAARDRDMLAAKMTPDQIAQAQALAAAWKPTPAGP